MFNIFFLVFVAVAVGLGLAIFITRQKTPGNALLVPPEEDYDRDPKEEKALHLEDLYRLAEKLCRENELTIKEKISQSPTEIYWIAESQNAFFFGNYVLAFVEVNEEKRFVTMSDVLEFKDFIKSVGSSKGFFFTTGYFTRDVHQPLEGPKVSLYNRLKVLTDLKS